MKEYSPSEVVFLDSIARKKPVSVSYDTGGLASGWKKEISTILYYISSIWCLEGFFFFSVYLRSTKI